MIKNILITLLICCFNIVFGQYIDNEKRQIIGTWVCKEVGWKFTFTTKKKCYEYVGDNISDPYKYKISNTSPQCDQKVLFDESKKTSYLELIDLKGTKRCFAINEFTPKTLYLTTVGQAHPYLFIRQTPLTDLVNISLRKGFKKLTEDQLHSFQTGKTVYSQVKNRINFHGDFYKINRMILQMNGAYSNAPKDHLEVTKKAFDGMARLDGNLSTNYSSEIKTINNYRVLIIHHEERRLCFL